MNPTLETRLTALAAWVAATYGLEGTLVPLPGEADANYRLDAPSGARYLLKVSPPGTAQDLLSLQNAMLTHLAARDTGLDLPRLLPGPDGALCLPLDAAAGGPGWARLFTWVEGTLWASLPHHSPGLLASLGGACGRLTAALGGFSHPAARRAGFKWDLAQWDWILAQRAAVTDPGQQALLTHFIDLYQAEVAPRRAQLRQGVIYNDANDHNILLAPTAAGDWQVRGLIDFGDACHSHLVHEVAIAGAYACMGLPDPLGGLAALVGGFHAAHPLEEAEIATIFPLLAMRLCVSVVNAARNRHAHPDNAYLLVSEAPAWDLLAQLAEIPPALAHYHLRHACGLVPCPAQPAFAAWAAAQPAGTFRPVLDLPADTPACPLDLSVGSTQLGGQAAFATPAHFAQTIAGLLAEAGATLGTGGYGEARPFYTTDAYRDLGNEGPRWRSIHLGLDLWSPAGTAVCAPYPGRVHHLRDHDQFLDYGPTVILRHAPADGPVFYSLYGHLSRTSLAGLREGQEIAAGEAFATLGDMTENGHWPPHLHVQLLLDPLADDGQFPGLAYPETAAVWQSICPDPALLLGAYYPAALPPPPPAEALRTGRATHLGPNLSLSYDPPLYIQRGYRQYLYDRGGRRYLDTVNNVAHVGHEHPDVVRAGQRQMAVLNTNTRYLHPEVVAFAEELQATLPDPLSVCYFVNSGSEANELALRMVRTATGRHDILALEIGYHGNTGACIAVSSYKFDGKGGQGAPPGTHLLPLPDPYRGRYRGPDSGALYAAHVPAALAAAEARGGLAGFIGESILSCGGQVVPPAGFLASVYAQVRAAGGLCIADEVQTGLGRVGEAFWAFAQQGVVPDVVTIGKPLGNGHPVAAVVTTRAIADAFANGMEYFNTFGGNPVSCAIGRAVLRTVAAEGLAAQAADTGAYLIAGLQDLQTRYPGIGEVRGAGLFLGIEFVTDPESRQPDPRTTAWLAQWMCRHGVLMSTDGPQHNILKIKPPMCFGRPEADFLLDRLERVLSTLPPVQ